MVRLNHILAPFLTHSTETGTGSLVPGAHPRNAEETTVGVGGYISGVRSVRAVVQNGVLWRGEADRLCGRVRVQRSVEKCCPKTGKDPWVPSPWILNDLRWGGLGSCR